MKEVKFRDHWITIIPLPETQLDEFVDLSLFGDFRPGTTFEEAVAKKGRPDNIRAGDHNTYYEYWEPLSRVEVGREEDAQGFGWALYAYPKDASYADVLSPAVSRHIDLSREETVVQIMNQNDQLAVLAYIRGIRVEHLIWYR